ncbi:MAG: hypothetical protein HC906_09280 [Bacteroidales bacterium]|nr:hypothetical protein [Bacteroidales bacterium]
MINLTGFGELTFQSTFGESPDEESAEIYEKYGLFDEYSEPRNDLVFSGIGLVLSSNLFEDKLTFLSELNFRTKKNRIELGIERCFLNYTFSNALEIRTGIYSTPIGSLNVHQRTHGFLSNSVKTRDLVNLDLGLIPTRIFGIQTESNFSLGNAATKLILSVGSGRGLTPNSSPFEVDLFEKEESSLSLSGILEFTILSEKMK